jgi:hypothetical protein
MKKIVLVLFVLILLTSFTHGKVLDNIWTGSGCEAYSARVLTKSQLDELVPWGIWEQDSKKEGKMVWTATTEPTGATGAAILNIQKGLYFDVAGLDDLDCIAFYYEISRKTSTGRNRSTTLNLFELFLTEIDDKDFTTAKTEFWLHGYPLLSDDASKVIKAAGLASTKYTGTFINGKIIAQLASVNSTWDRQFLNFEVRFKPTTAKARQLALALRKIAVYGVDRKTALDRASFELEKISKPTLDVIYFADTKRAEVKWEKPKGTNIFITVHGDDDIDNATIIYKDIPSFEKTEIIDLLDARVAANNKSVTYTAYVIPSYLYSSKREKNELLVYVGGHRNTRGFKKFVASNTISLTDGATVTRPQLEASKIYFYNLTDTEFAAIKEGTKKWTDFSRITQINYEQLDRVKTHSQYPDKTEGTINLTEKVREQNDTTGITLAGPYAIAVPKSKLFPGELNEARLSKLRPYVESVGKTADYEFKHVSTKNGEEAKGVLKIIYSRSLGAPTGTILGELHRLNKLIAGQLFDSVVSEPETAN